MLVWLTVTDNIQVQLTGVRMSPQVV